MGKVIRKEFCPGAYTDSYTGGLINLMTSGGKCCFFRDCLMACKHTGTKQSILQAWKFWLSILANRITIKNSWKKIRILPVLSLFTRIVIQVAILVALFSNLDRDYMKVGSVMTGFTFLLQQEFP